MWFFYMFNPICLAASSFFINRWQTLQLKIHGDSEQIKTYYIYPFLDLWFTYLLCSSFSSSSRCCLSNSSLVRKQNKFCYTRSSILKSNGAMNDDHGKCRKKDNLRRRVYFFQLHRKWRMSWPGLLIRFPAAGHINLKSLNVNEFLGGNYWGDNVK